MRAGAATVGRAGQRQRARQLLDARRLVLVGDLSRVVRKGRLGFLRALGLGQLVDGLERQGERAAALLPRADDFAAGQIDLSLERAGNGFHAQSQRAVHQRDLVDWDALGALIGAVERGRELAFRRLLDVDHHAELDARVERPQPMAGDALCWLLVGRRLLGGRWRSIVVRQSACPDARQREADRGHQFEPAVHVAPRHRPSSLIHVMNPFTSKAKLPSPIGAEHASPRREPWECDRTTRRSSVGAKHDRVPRLPLVDHMCRPAGAPTT